MGNAVPKVALFACDTDKPPPDEVMIVGDVANVDVTMLGSFVIFDNSRVVDEFGGVVVELGPLVDCAVGTMVTMLAKSRNSWPLGLRFSTTRVCSVGPSSSD